MREESIFYNTQRVKIVNCKLDRILNNVVLKFLRIEIEQVRRIKKERTFLIVHSIVLCPRLLDGIQNESELCSSIHFSLCLDYKDE